MTTKLNRLDAGGKWIFSDEYVHYRNNHGAMTPEEWNEMKRGIARDEHQTNPSKSKYRIRKYRCGHLTTVPINDNNEIIEEPLCRLCAQKAEPKKDSVSVDLKDFGGLLPVDNLKEKSNKRELLSG